MMWIEYIYQVPIERRDIVFRIKERNNVYKQAVANKLLQQ